VCLPTAFNGQALAQAEQTRRKLRATLARLQGAAVDVEKHRAFLQEKLALFEQCGNTPRPLPCLALASPRPAAKPLLSVDAGMWREAELEPRSRRRPLGAAQSTRSTDRCGPDRLAFALPSPCLRLVAAGTSAACGSTP
jgi:hypothetical protein